MDPLVRRTLGQTNVQVTCLGFGGATLGDIRERIDESRSATTIEVAYGAGIGYFDTAPWYGTGKSERRYGNVLGLKPRDSYVLSTKIGRVLERPADPATFEPERWRWGLPHVVRFDYTYDGVMRSLEHSPARLDPVQQSTLEGLRRDGVHRTNVGELLAGAVDMRRVRADAEALLQRPATREQIASRRSREGVKWYVVRAFGYRPRIPIPASFAGLLLDDRVLAVANAYLGVTSRLKYLDVWHNFPVSESDPPIDSELWHRDNEDRNLVKLFIHLSDVDDTAGPLTYIRGSQPGGPPSLLSS